MRILLGTLFLANIVFLFGSIPWWTKTGAPNEWVVHILIAVLFCIGFSILAGIYSACMFLFEQGMSEIFSVSNSEVRMSDDTRRIMVRRLQFVTYYHNWGTVAFLFCTLLAQWAFIQFRQNSLDVVSYSINVAFIVLGIFCIVDMILLPLWFRLPKEKDSTVSGETMETSGYSNTAKKDYFALRALGKGK